MFVIQKGKYAYVFRDQYSIDLESELYGNPKLANLVIDEIFNLKQVLIADPVIAGSGTGKDQKHWIVVTVTVKPINNEEECEKFTTVLNSIKGVEFVNAIRIYPPEHEEIKKHLYGGKRSKI